MKFARRMRQPSRPRFAGRAVRWVLLCAVCWLGLHWTYVLMSFSTSTSLAPPSAADVSGGGGAANGRHAGRNDDKQDRSLSQFNATEHGHLRARPPSRVGTAASQPRQSRDLNQTAPVSSLVYPLHAKSGTHHAYLYIGSPPQRQTLIVDTGSRLTAFPCRPHCPDCGTHASKPFQLNASSSHEVVSCDQCKLSNADFPIDEYFEGDGVGGNSGDGPSLLRGGVTNIQRRRSMFPDSCVNSQCEIEQRYTEGSSWKAFEVQDRVWLGLDGTQLSVREHDMYATPFAFGCQVSEQGLFRAQYADGIMGLSMYTQSLVGTMKEHGSVPHESFSLCLNRKGGHISLGGTGSTYPATDRHSGEHFAPMQFTPFAKDNVWYYTVTVTSISVGVHVLPAGFLQYVNDHKGVIVDSGTTDTFISHKLAKPFITAWERVTGRRYHNRLQKLTYEEFNILPVVTFELSGGVKWEISPKDYMEVASQNANQTAAFDGPWEGTRGFISRIYVDEPRGVVLGSNAMLGKELFFDVENKRLGVAKATCAY